MAVASPDLSIELSEVDNCGGILLTDTTGLYNAISNPLGYGLPGGPDINDVTFAEIIFNYVSLGTDVTTALHYTFTISSGVITAATLATDGGFGTDVTSALPSTVWPFDSDNPFEITADYGVSIPEFMDDVCICSYSISGEVAAEEFEASTSTSIAVTCHLEECLQTRFVNIDFDCDCDSAAMDKALLIEALKKQAEYAAAPPISDNALASAALNRATRECDDECEGC